jgi:16S rRNA (guanine(966)-N(2))-methyltransferase RsmD
VKQSGFAIMEPSIRGRPFLDLYAGSGAAGIEALSRGASSAVFVDSDRAAVMTISRNLTSTGLAGDAAVVVRGRVLDVLPRARRDPFGAIFVDPPYDRPGELERALEIVARAGPGGILAADGILVAKHFRKTQVPAEIGLLRSFRRERFGETVLTFHRWAAEIASHGVVS